MIKTESDKVENIDKFVKYVQNNQSPWSIICRLLNVALKYSFLASFRDNHPYDVPEVIAVPVRKFFVVTMPNFQLLSWILILEKYYIFYR